MFISAFDFDGDILNNVYSRQDVYYNAFILHDNPAISSIRQFIFKNHYAINKNLRNFLRPMPYSEIEPFSSIVNTDYIIRKNNLNLLFYYAHQTDEYKLFAISDKDKVLIIPIKAFEDFLRTIVSEDIDFIKGLKGFYPKNIKSEKIKNIFEKRNNNYHFFNCAKTMIIVSKELFARLELYINIERETEEFSLIPVETKEIEFKEVKFNEKDKAYKFKDDKESDKPFYVDAILKGKKQKQKWRY